MVKGLLLIFKGMLLGLSIILPGLSGGTMAFILGIYEKLITEISKFNSKHLKSFLLCFSLKKQRVKQSFFLLKNTWDWAFLFPIIFGTLCSVILFVSFAYPLLTQHSLEFYSLIFGLVLASLFTPFKEMKKTRKTISLLLLSFIINVFLFKYGKSLFIITEDLLPLFFLPVGFIVSVALMIPGISGSYLLLVFGLYEKTLMSLKQGNLLILFCFLFGALLGLFSIARLINYLIKNYFNETIAIILGLILGSLYIIYPLPKESLESILSFNLQKKIFLIYSILSVIVFLCLSLLIKKEKISI